MIVKMKGGEQMFEYKDWTRIEPCVCGRLMHVPEAIYCSWCGRKLATEHDEATERLILQIAALKDAFEAWKTESQPQDEAAGAEDDIR